MRPYAVAQGTGSGLLGENTMEHEKRKKKCIHRCDWVPLLYSRNGYNMVINYTSLLQKIFHIYICMHIGVVLSHKKERDNAIFSNMEGPRDYHTT